METLSFMLCRTLSTCGLENLVKKDPNLGHTRPPNLFLFAV